MTTLITGVSGQDGSYLAEQLVGSGERITGVIQPGQLPPAYVEAVSGKRGCSLVPCDIASPAAFRALLKDVRPTRVFHLAAVSEPAQCEQQPDMSRAANVTSVEVLREWVRQENPAARVLVLSSAAIFGVHPPVPQSEETAAAPAGEYGRQKLRVRDIAREARQAGLYFACAIPFNHESTRRPESFVFSKVCRSAARIALGQQKDPKPRQYDLAARLGLCA